MVGLYQQDVKYPVTQFGFLTILKECLKKYVIYRQNTLITMIISEFFIVKEKH